VAAGVGFNMIIYRCDRCNKKMDEDENRRIEGFNKFSSNDIMHFTISIKPDNKHFCHDCIRLMVINALEDPNNNILYGCNTKYISNK